MADSDAPTKSSRPVLQVFRRRLAPKPGIQFKRTGKPLKTPTKPAKVPGPRFGFGATAAGQQDSHHRQQHRQHSQAVQDSVYSYSNGPAQAAAAACTPSAAAAPAQQDAMMQQLLGQLLQQQQQQHVAAVLLGAQPQDYQGCSMAHYMQGQPQQQQQQAPAAPAALAMPQQQQHMPHDSPEHSSHSQHSQHHLYHHASVESHPCSHQPSPTTPQQAAAPAPEMAPAAVQHQQQQQPEPSLAEVSMVVRMLLAVAAQEASPDLACQLKEQVMCHVQASVEAAEAAGQLFNVADAVLQVVPVLQEAVLLACSQTNISGTSTATAAADAAAVQEPSRAQAVLMQQQQQGLAAAAPQAASQQDLSAILRQALASGSSSSSTSGAGQLLWEAAAG